MQRGLCGLELASEVGDCACTVRSSVLCVASVHANVYARSITRMKTITLGIVLHDCVSETGLLLKARASVSRYDTAIRERSAENVKVLKAGNKHLLTPRVHSWLTPSRSCEVICLLELTSKQIEPPCSLHQTGSLDRASKTNAMYARKNILASSYYPLSYRQLDQVMHHTAIACYGLAKTKPAPVYA